MSAAIIAFPAPARRTAVRQTEAISAAALAGKFADHFLPIVQASTDLLEADEQTFEARCREMIDADGGTMVDDLCVEIEIVGRQMRVLVDGLDLTRARLRTAVARLAPTVETSGETV